MSESDETPTTPEQVRRARAALRMTLANAGFGRDQQGLKNELRTYIRETVFKKVKFARQELLGSEGNVYKAIKQHIGFDVEQHNTRDLTDADKQVRKEKYDKQFDALWNRWILRETKNTITKQRNSITQRVQRSVVQGKEFLTRKNVECVSVGIQSNRLPVFYSKSDQKLKKKWRTTTKATWKSGAIKFKTSLTTNEIPTTICIQCSVMWF